MKTAADKQQNPNQTLQQQLANAPEFWQDHTATDSNTEIFHSTNVTLYAAGLEQGIASDAKVVVFSGGIVNSQGRYVLTAGTVYVCMHKILNMAVDKTTSVLNCGFRGVAPSSPSYHMLKDNFNEFLNQGGQIVGCLGNTQPSSEPPIAAVCKFLLRGQFRL
jgi:hypothetical protein